MQPAEPKQAGWNRRWDSAEAKDERANTFEYRRVMSTTEALATWDVTKTSGGYLGSQDTNLPKVLDKDKGLNHTTCHQGQAQFVYVDGLGRPMSRELIGVVYNDPGHAISSTQTNI